MQRREGRRARKEMYDVELIGAQEDQYFIHMRVGNDGLEVKRDEHV